MEAEKARMQTILDSAKKTIGELKSDIVKLES